jgi:hypothetical protein
VRAQFRRTGDLCGTKGFTTVKGELPAFAAALVTTQEQNSPPSAEAIRALADLIKAASGHAHSGWLTPEGFKSVTEFVGTII